MAKKHSLSPINAVLRDAILRSEKSFAALERETGVLRQSLMRFVQGKQQLRGDMLDKLAVYFGLELTTRKNESHG